ncbi:MAG: hypothetical protein IJ141_06045 [Lachnospiraceae bacterium]|nr:hypothetical protein [Lachnospiraceae bacterium]
MRLGVYVIYDFENKIEKYTSIVLKELRKYVDYIVVVCNFEHCNEGLDYINDYCNEIYFRENSGYDAGAYKDALVHYITWEKAFNFDELLLTNDSYFGPLYSFDDMFNKMNNCKCDYWGITTSPKGEYDNIKYDTHIQSYFINFKKKTFHSKDFVKFWEDYVCKDNRFGTIVSYELELNKYLKERGYVGKSYADVQGFLPLTNTNPYINYAYELIKDIKIPIIKKAIFNAGNVYYANLCEAVSFINDNLMYDVKIINDYIENKRDKGAYLPYYDFDIMEKFVNMHNKIYVYGYGNWAKMLSGYFKYRGWKIESFLVTDIKNNEVAELFSKKQIEKNDGIIIAQESKEVCNEIIKYINCKCDNDQILTPIYQIIKK